MKRLMAAILLITIIGLLVVGCSSEETAVKESTEDNTISGDITAVDDIDAELSNSEVEDTEELLDGLDW